jgi:hypothetical protein
MPEADKTHLQMIRMFSEHEARAISTWTKAALTAAKASGPRPPARLLFEIQGFDGARTRSAEMARTE